MKQLHSSQIFLETDRLTFRSRMDDGRSFPYVYVRGALPLTFLIKKTLLLDNGLHTRVIRKSSLIGPGGLIVPHKLSVKFPARRARSHC